MGNTESNVTSGVKKQAGASMQPIYKLCDLKGIFHFLSFTALLQLGFRWWAFGRIDEKGYAKQTVRRNWSCN